MPWSDEGVYIHKIRVPDSGDALRCAAFQLAYDVESYLFDGDHKGYMVPAFLDWAVERFLAQHVSSGNAVDRINFWDPDAPLAGTTADLDNTDKTHRVWGGGSASHDTIRYSDDAKKGGLVEKGQIDGDESEFYVPAGDDEPRPTDTKSKGSK